jgi:hypothetical protein
LSLSPSLRRALSLSLFISLSLSLYILSPLLLSLLSLPVSQLVDSYLFVFLTLQRFTSTHKLIYVPTSAKTGEGVEYLFGLIALHLLAPSVSKSSSVEEEKKPRRLSAAIGSLLHKKDKEKKEKTVKKEKKR